MIVFIKEIYILLLTGTIKKSSSSIIIKIKSIFLILFLLLSTTTLSIIFVWIFFKIFQIELPENNLQKSLSKESIFARVLISALLVPIMEELAHRLWLKYSKFNIAISCGILGYYFLGIFSKLSLIKIPNFSIHSFFSLIIGFFSFIVLVNFSSINLNIIKFYSKHKILLYYSSIFLFSLFHIFNFDLNNKVIFLMPIITLPQTISGIFLIYVRLKYGIFYSIFLHSLMNLIPFIKYIFL